MAFTTCRSEQEQQIRARERVQETVLPALKETFRPELLNRIDEIVVFHPLDQQHLREIVDLLVAQTQHRLIEQSITLKVTEAARSLLVQRGCSPEYGARPLRRTVQTLLEDMLAEAILQNTITPGETVIVDTADGALSMRTMALATSNANIERASSGVVERFLGPHV